jgi:hypothetical protein
MPIPNFDPNGLLPVGRHDCGLEEIRPRFGSFTSSDRRPTLFAKLEEFVREVRIAAFANSLLIDGSFVTAKLAPNDIDIVLVLPILHDLSADLPRVRYNLVSRKRVQKKYGFDIVAVRENTIEYEEAVEFFQRVRNEPGLRKGILRVLL